MSFKSATIMIGKMTAIIMIVLLCTFSHPYNFSYDYSIILETYSQCESYVNKLIF